MSGSAISVLRLTVSESYWIKYVHCVNGRYIKWRRVSLISPFCVCVCVSVQQMFPIFPKMRRGPTKLHVEEMVESRQTRETNRQQPDVRGRVGGSRISSTQYLTEQRAAPVDRLGQTAGAVPRGSLQRLFLRVRLCSATQAMIKLLFCTSERTNGLQAELAFRNKRTRAPCITNLRLIQKKKKKKSRRLQSLYLIVAAMCARRSLNTFLKNHLFFQKTF